MKKLEDTIKKNGFTYNLVKRDGDVAMYSQYSHDRGVNRVVGYEVFTVKRREKATMIFGKLLEPAELFPRNGDFGSTAFSYMEEKNATAKYQELINGK